MAIGPCCRPTVAVVEPHRGTRRSGGLRHRDRRAERHDSDFAAQRRSSGRAEDRRRQCRPKGSAAGPPRKRRFAARDSPAAAAEERYAKSQLDRQAQLVERGVTSRGAYDRASADWEKAKALRERAEAEAALSRSRRPRRRYNHPPRRRDRPDHQPPTSRFSGCSCCAPLRVSAEVDEEDIAQVRPGQEVLICCRCISRGRFSAARCSRSRRRATRWARTYRVRIALPEDTPLMIGMTGETNIVLRNADNALLAARRGGAAGRGVARD